MQLCATVITLDRGVDVACVPVRVNLSEMPPAWKARTNIRWTHVRVECRMLFIATAIGMQSNDLLESIVCGACTRQT